MKKKSSLLGNGTMNHNLGFSLVEVIVVIGIMSLLTLGGAELFRINFSKQQSVAKGFQMENLHEEIRVFLSKDEDCTASFAGIDPTTTVNITALKRAGPPVTNSQYVSNALLGDNHVYLTSMKIDGTKYIASSTPFTAEVPIEIQYKKNGKDIGMTDYKRTIVLKLKLDPAGTGLIQSCVSKAKTTDGLWRQTLTSPPGQTNIFYSSGTVSVGTTTPNDGANLHIHNETSQGSLLVSGNSDAGQTWSAVYLSDGNANNKSAASNGWVTAFKRNALGGTVPNRLEFNYQGRSAGSWQSLDIVNSLTMIPPNPPTTPWSRVTIGGATSDPNVMLHVFNRSHQGQLTVAGAGEATGGSNTWAALYLQDQNSANQADASNGWVFGYKKSVGNSDSEHLAIAYTIRPSGTYTMSQRPALILGPGSGTGGWVGVATVPTAPLDVGGDTLIRGRMTVQSTLNVSGNLTVNSPSTFNGNVTVNGTVTATSDRRLKTDIKPLGQGTLEKVLNLQGVSYLRREPANSSQQKREIGFVAQEVEKIFPEFVETNSNGFKSVNYSQIVAAIVEGMKGLDQKSNQCQAEQKQMKTELQNLRRENDEIKQQIQELKKLMISLEEKTKQQSK